MQTSRYFDQVKRAVTSAVVGGGRGLAREDFERLSSIAATIAGAGAGEYRHDPVRECARVQRYSAADLDAVSRFVAANPVSGSGQPDRRLSTSGTDAFFAASALATAAHLMMLAASDQYGAHTELANAARKIAEGAATLPPPA